MILKPVDIEARSQGTQIQLDDSFVRAGVVDREIGSVAESYLSVVLRNVILRTGDIMVVKNHGQPCFTFVQISRIVLYNEKWLFHCYVMYKVKNREQLSGFILRLTSNSVVLTAEKFLYPWPLLDYKRDDGYLCIPRCGVFH